MSAADRANQSEPDERIAVALASAVEASLDFDLDDAARQIVRDTVQRHQALARKLRAVPLANSDEPDFTFVPYRAEG